MSKSKSSFQLQTILPNSTKRQLSAAQSRDSALNYEKQKPLTNNDIDKYRTSLIRQHSIELLRQGYHASFRNLCELLKIEIRDRRRLGKEHPLYRRDLLDKQAEKLRFLCLHLMKIEDAERQRLYALAYNNYLILASFFNNTDDFCLADHYYRQALKLTEDHAKLDPLFSAEAYGLLALAHERRGDLFKAVTYSEKYRELSENNYRLRAEANLQLTGLYLKLATHHGSPLKDRLVLLAFEAAQQSNNERILIEAGEKLAETLLEQSQVDRAVELLVRAHRFAQKTNNIDMFGSTAVSLAICYQKLNQIEKSIEYLQEFLSAMKHEENHPQYARVCIALGLIGAIRCDYRTAVKFISQAYSLSLANEHPNLDRHRVFYGIANGFQLLPFFNDHIDRMNLKDLLSWKSIRIERNLIQKTRI